MAFTKKMILATMLCSVCLGSFPQEKEHYFINDKTVRLRNEPGLNGKIIRVLDKNETVEYISGQDLYDGSDNKWINVHTSKGTGWVFGEFVSKSLSHDKQFQNIEDAGIKMSKGILYSGIHEEELLQILGQPQKRIFDEEYNEDTLSYGSDEDLVFLVHKYNQRIHHIIIKSPIYMLTNNVKIGMNISAIDPKNIKKINTYLYTCTLQNLLRSSFFDASVSITTDQKGAITEIQIGLPQ